MRKFVLILIIALAFVGCGDKDDDPICDCDPKEHYLPCTCGGTDCTCEVIDKTFRDTAAFKETEQGSIKE